MRKTVHIAAAALITAAVGLMFASPANAAGSDVLTTGSVGGNNVAVGNVASSGLKASTNAVFATGSSNVSCATSNFSGSILTNPAAGGVATESLTAQTFTSCTPHITGVTKVNSITVNNLPYTAAVDGTAKTIKLTPGSAGPIQATVSLQSILGAVTCVYTANNASNANEVDGTTSNTDNSINFSSAGFKKSSGSGLCPSTASLTASYAPVGDTSVTGSPAVFVQ
jgi:hypothetical protein